MFLRLLMNVCMWVCARVGFCMCTHVAKGKMQRDRNRGKTMAGRQRISYQRPLEIRNCFSPLRLSLPSSGCVSPLWIEAMSPLRLELLRTGLCLPSDRCSLLPAAGLCLPLRLGLPESRTVSPLRMGVPGGRTASFPSHKVSLRS